MKRYLKRTLLAIFALALISSPFLAGCDCDDDDDKNPADTEVLGTAKEYMPLPAQNQDTLWTFKVNAERKIYYSENATTPDKIDPVQGTAYAQVGGTTPALQSLMNGITGLPVYPGFDAGSGTEWADNGQPIGYLEYGSDGSLVGKSNNASDPALTLLPKELRAGQSWQVSPVPFDSATYTVTAVELMTSYTNAEGVQFANVVKVNVVVSFAKTKKWTQAPQLASLNKKEGRIQLIPSQIEYNSSEQVTANFNLYFAKNVGPAGGQIQNYQSTYKLTETEIYTNGSGTPTLVEYRKEDVTGTISRTFPAQN